MASRKARNSPRGHLRRRLLSDGRIQYDGLEGAPVVAVGGGTATARAGFDVVLDQGRDGERFTGFALGRSRIVPERGVTQRLTRELASVGQAQRRKRAERRTAQSGADTVEDAGRAPIVRRDTNAEAWEVFVEELETTRLRRTCPFDRASGQLHRRHRCLER
jgi:hypothetical protein